MPRATVTIKFVNQPKEGKKFGSINTEEMAISVRSRPSSLFVKGQKYVIEYAEKGEYKDFLKIIEAPKPVGNGDGAWQVPNFVSNIVGQAIVAGKIEGPGDIKMWALAAKEAGEAVLGIGRKEPAGGHRRMSDAIPS